MTIDRLKAAWRALWDREEWPPNAGHRYEVKTLDVSYYADVVRYDEMTGYPEWELSCPGYRLHCKRLENAVIKEYRY